MPENENLVYRYALSACEKLNQGQAQEALQLINRSLIHGRRGWSLLLRARVKMALGHEWLSIGDVTRAFDIDSEAGWIFDLPVGNLRLPGHAAARNLYELNRWFRKDPGSFAVHAFVGKLKAIAGRTQEGLDHFNWAIKRHPKWAYLYSWRAETLRRLGRMESALADTRKAIDLNPRDAVAWTAQAACLRALKQYRRALKSALRGARLKPDYEVAALEAARASLAVRDSRSLLLWLERAALRAGRYGWRNLYEGREREGVFSDFGFLAADPALKHSQWRGRLLAWQGEALMSAGRPQEALACFESALRLAPSFGLAHAWLGEALFILGRPDLSLNHLNRALKISPRYARARAARGQVYLKQGKPQYALIDFDATIKQDSTWAWIRYWRARALLHLQKPAQARQELDIALVLDSRFRDAKELKEKMESRR